MSDLIRRGDVLGYISRLNGCGLGKVKSLEYIRKYVERPPSADRPQGEWIDMGDFEKCSVCKGTHLKEFQSYYGKITWIKTPYCPQCGARMKGADDETAYEDPEPTQSSDLIKRSDAIEAIEDVTWFHQDRNKDMVIGASEEGEAWYKAQDIYDALDKVPTAKGDDY